MATSDVGHIPAISGGVNDAESYAKNLALSALNLTANPERLLFFYHPFYARGELGLTLSLTGTATRTGQLQALRLSTGATGLSNAEVFATTTASATAPRYIATGAGKKWWVGGYFSINNGIAASEFAGIMGNDLSSGQVLSVGARGSSSATNFTAWASTNGTIDSGLALDTNKRLHQFWRDGTTAHYKIDTNPAVSGNVSPGANCLMEAGAKNFSSNDRAIDIVWMAVAAERE